MLFKYAFLPVELKNVILSVVGVDESLKLTQTDKYSRGFILKNGPFQRKIEQVELFFDEDWRGDDEDRFYVDVNTKNETTKLSIGDTIEIDNYESYIEQSIRRSAFWRLFNRILSIKEFSLRFELGESCYEHEFDAEMVGEMMTEFFKKQPILPLLSVVLKLSVETTEFEIAKVAMKTFKPKITDICHLTIAKSDTEIERETIENYLKSYFGEPHLAECQQLYVSDVNFLNYDQLATNTKMLFHLNCHEVLRIIEEVLESGIPGSFQAFGVRGRTLRRNRSTGETVLTKLEEIFNQTSELENLTIDQKKRSMIDFIEKTCKQDGILPNFDAFSRGFLSLNSTHKNKSQWFFGKKFNGNDHVISVSSVDRPETKPTFVELQLIIGKF